MNREVEVGGDGQWKAYIAEKWNYFTSYMNSRNIKQIGKGLRNM